MLEFVLVYGGVYILGLLYALTNVKYGGVAGRLGFPLTEFNAFIVAFIFQTAATVLLVWLATVVLNGASWGDLGIRGSSGKNFVGYGLLAGIALLFLVALMSIILARLQPNIQPQEFERILRTVHTAKGFIVMLVMGCVLAPLAEELLFRGMLYPAVRRYLGPVGGAIVAGIIFGMVHWDIWRAIPLAIGGIVLCYIYEKTGSILVSAVAHGVWNGIMALIIYFTVFKMV